MPTQLAFDFSFKLAPPDTPSFQSHAWHDVTDVARSVGFTDTIMVSAELEDGLGLQQSDLSSDYDQRLYDLLWLAHFKLSLNQSQSASFAFGFTQEHKKTEQNVEITFQVRIETQDEILFLGLLRDF